MDLTKTGKFIQQQRKAKNLTQMQLAEKLNISEKTISKWECGKGFPDTSLILPLCNELDISANELLGGNKINENDYKNKAEKTIIDLTNQDQYKTKLLLSLEWVVLAMSVLILLTCCALFSFSTLSQTWRIVILALGIATCLVGIGLSLKIEKDIGFYVCKHCGHKHVPTFNQMLWSMHIGRTRFFKCPHCHKRSWNKKTTSAN